MNIELNKEYKYKEVCAIRGEEQKTGKSRQLQIKDWHRYFNWENPTTQIYRIIEIYDIPKEKIDGRINNGGFRDGSGVKVKVKDEFDFLFTALIHRDFNRNSGGGKMPNLCTTYFTNKEVSLYFGFYNENFYSATRINDEKVDKNVFLEVGNKIREKLNSWVYNKIEKLKNTELTYGIIAYKNDGKNKDFDYKDEWLEEWNKYQAEYLKIKEYSGLYKVFDNDEYIDMVDYISKHFDGYSTVLKCRKVKFDVKMLVEYDWDLYNHYVKSLNTKLVNELKQFFNKKYTDTTDYDYIIDKYVKL